MPTRTAVLRLAAVVGRRTLICLLALSGWLAWGGEVEPANPRTNARAREVLRYFYEVSARKEGRLLSGQFTDFGRGANVGILKQIHDQHGRWPALMGADYADFSNGSLRFEEPNRAAITYWRQGGLVTMNAHLYNPANPKGGGLRDQGVDLEDLLNPGETHDRWMRQLDMLAEGLQELQRAGVVVLWRPFHEVNGGWFWWGAKDPEVFKRVWKHMFAYFSETKELDNLLWVYGPNHGQKTAAYYAGDRYVDIVGIDAYTDFIDPEHIKGCAEVIALGKPFGFTEYGPFGPQRPPGDYDYRRFIEGIVKHFPQSCFFMSWNAKWSLARNEHVTAALLHPWVVNREDLPAGLAGRLTLLPPEPVGRYVQAFNQTDDELYGQYVPNAQAAEFLQGNVPRFECPDPEFEKTYYFRWWTFRKHLKQTPDGFVITEFLPPVPWAGKYNTIPCAAGHHLYEGRWLHDTRFVNDYSRFWFREGSEPRRYTFWAADALWARYAADGYSGLITNLLPSLVQNCDGWVTNRFDTDANLFWQNDGEDGMEVSIGGGGLRATINSVMFGEANAIARIADLARKPEMAETYRKKAEQLKATVLQKLWDPQAGFFKVLPRGQGKALADVRELHGYTPWYFGLAEESQSAAWKQLVDPQGFSAPSGLTTAERRHPKFALSYEGHECQWNGPSWPYATAVTLTALARHLQESPQPALTKKDYFDQLKIYAQAHRLKRDDGQVVPWIDENLNPLTGDWIARTRLKSWKDGTWSTEKGGRERGKDYNHSTFCDLVITGLVGLRPTPGSEFEVSPLVPDGSWDYFCLDNLIYHGRYLTILWDRTGERYHRGQGLRVLVDGQEIARSAELKRLKMKLP
jgi:hypothetical protein